MERCFATAQLLIRRSVSVATWQAYSKVCLEWDDLVRKVGGCADDEDRVHMLLYFIGRNFENGISASYMSRKWAGLDFMFQLAGQRDTTKAFMVRRAMRGYHVGQTAADTRCPVSFMVLGEVVEQLQRVCMSCFEWVLFWAVFTLAFFGAFRVGELVSRNKKGDGGLDVHDV